MEIKRKKSMFRSTLSPGFKISYFIIIFILLVIWGFLFYADIKVKEKGFSGIFDFTGTIISNYRKTFSAKPEKISIKIDETSFKKLSDRRGVALERGLIINDEDSFVPGVLTYKKKELKIKIRLKGHMTDHLQGDKWSFRVRIKDEDNFKGMRLFSLQHPGTRGYIYEWIYHQLMKREGIIALRYSFLKLELNGKDLGIYAVEENFDKELISNNKRNPGPLMRFNPHMYWVDRYNEILREKPVAEFATYQSANFEPYRKENVLEDSSQKVLYLRALELMERFRRVKLNTHEVFDISLLSKFHAIIDLVGGHHSLDWSDIKYYYNPVTDKLEPVAYESFTILPAKQISGTYRFLDRDNPGLNEDFHKALFSDPVFFKEYIKQLERMTTPSYLESFFSSVEEPLQKNLAILYKEFPYKKFDKALYYKNSKIIQKMLNPPKAFHAYVQSITGDTLKMKIGSIESLPVELKAVLYNNQQIAYPQNEVVLASKQQGINVRYQNVHFLLNKKINSEFINDLEISYSILGSSVIKKDKTYPYPYPEISSQKDSAAIGLVK